MNVFDAFPNAVETWTMGKISRDTLTGDTTLTGFDIEVICDDVKTSTLGGVSTPAEMDNDSLLFVKINSNFSSLTTENITANYYVYDGIGYYRIRQVGLGKNQHTGEIEHVELVVTPYSLGGASE